MEHKATRAFAGPLERHWDQLGSAESPKSPKTAASKEGLPLRRTAKEAEPAEEAGTVF